MDSSRNLNGRVLVLGDDTRSFLTVIRSLGRAGLEVHVAWCPHVSPSLRSRYIARVHWLPAYREDDQAWLHELLHLLRREQFDLVIPIPDTAILPLQHWRRCIEPVCRCSLLNDHAFEVTFSKRKTYDLAVKLGIAVPRQRHVRSFFELQLAVEDFGFPVVLKPESSFTLDNIVSRNKVITLRNGVELAAAADDVHRTDGVLVQQHFLGAGMGIEVLSKQGEILTAFQHERIHEPLMGGGSSYRKSVPLHAAMLESVRKLMKELNYTGVAMVEFKMNPATGAWVLIEINGRFWGSLPLSVAAGLDFPRFLYDMLCNGRTSFPTTYRTNYFARNWLADFYWARHNFRADHTEPALMTVPVRRLPREIMNLVLLRESSDTFAWDDPWPAFAEIREYGRKKVLPRVIRLGVLRRRMQRAARAAAAKANRILFMCKGNICRSPFAEEALRYLTHGRIDVRSTGYLPTAGRPSPEEAVSAASELGIDLTRHHSHFIDAQTVVQADLILFFDSENETFLREKFPDALTKAYYLGALDPSESLEIEDPLGGGIEAFRRSYSKIFTILETLRVELSPSGS